MDIKLIIKPGDFLRPFKKDKTYVQDIRPSQGKDIDRKLLYLYL